MPGSRGTGKRLGRGVAAWGSGGSIGRRGGMGGIPPPKRRESQAGGRGGNGRWGPMRRKIGRIGGPMVGRDPGVR